jgi:hypothetical protein
MATVHLAVGQVYESIWRGVPFRREILEIYGESNNITATVIVRTNGKKREVFWRNWLENWCSKATLISEGNTNNDEDSDN